MMSEDLNILNQSFVSSCTLMNSFTSMQKKNIKTTVVPVYKFGAFS